MQVVARCLLLENRAACMTEHAVTIVYIYSSNPEIRPPVVCTMYEYTCIIRTVYTIRDVMHACIQERKGEGTIRLYIAYRESS